jgi:hypothetical protein
LGRRLLRSPHVSRRTHPATSGAFALTEYVQEQRQLMALSWIGGNLIKRKIIIATFQQSEEINEDKKTRQNNKWQI